MYYKGHLLFGFLAGLLLVLSLHFFLGVFVFDLLSVVTFLVVVFVVSLLPDVDHVKSFASMYNDIIGFVFFVSLCLVGLLFFSGLVSFSWFIPAFLLGLLFTFALVYDGRVNKRGFLHSVFFCPLLGVLVGLLSWSFWFGLLGFVVCLVHVLVDMLSL